MPLRFYKKNILATVADVLVNPSDGHNFNENRISRAISSSAGEKYYETIKNLNPIDPGNTVFTHAGELLYQFVAHVALPDWYGGKRNERELLDSCYTEVLYRAEEYGCKSVVFPILGVGLYGMPYKESLQIAVRAVESYLSINDNLLVCITTLDEDLYEYIANHYSVYCVSPETDSNVDPRSLDYKLSNLGYTFWDSLAYYMARANLTHVQCYTVAGIDKKLFSKIKSNPTYLPSKPTILKFVFALRLSIKDAQQLLKTCGYVLSDSLVEDVIVMHLLSQGKFEYQTFQDELQKRSL